MFSPDILTTVLQLYQYQSYFFMDGTWGHSLPKISPRFPGFRWMAFGLRRVKVLG